ncbi:glutathione peroxidase [Microbacter margulisiae]|uniref:Glutathione peroxidase n=2 Tax=Microbacter margulisiae TaxID=1350067 RepID=A0A7W5DNM1_9PORP|nr:glutathione peroxidase [Microbacter margulisiae]
MKTMYIKTMIPFMLLLSVTVMNGQTNRVQNIYRFQMNNINGQKIPLSDYKGKVVLIVNTASKCGFTPQYAGLEQLYKTYKNKGFVVLGFPCNQFANQEPGTSEQIKQFCMVKYGVTFPMFEKIEVNGMDTNPLYAYLKSTLPLQGKNDIRWNFEKFLINKDGVPVKRFAPNIKPKELNNDIEDLLK